MSKRVTAADAAAQLRAADRILLLTHQYPDGDTLGSAYALCRALCAVGKQARVMCADPVPRKYAYMLEGLEEQAFEPAFICAVDVADTRLLGEMLQPYAERVALCIDHHGSNVEYADCLLLDAGCSATAMLVAEVIRAMGVPLDRPMAEAVYTGLATDTGCFKYSNTTPQAHRLAAELMECGIAYDAINRTMFDMKSRARVELERQALDGMRFFFDGRCAVMSITAEMVRSSGAEENDMEGLAPLPRQIENVWVGLTLREKADGTFKVSARTGPQADAAAVCARLGGGGHVRAAGCTVAGTTDEVIRQMLQTVEETVPAIRTGQPA